MRLIAAFILCPFLLIGQADPPLMFHEEPIMTVDQKIRHEWMDGPEALQKEKERNSRLLREHQFPLMAVLFWMALACFLILIVIFDKKIIRWVKSRMSKPIEPKEKAREELKQVEAVEEWGDRYSLLSKTVRNYIQNRYQIPASVQTNEEWMAQISAAKIYSREEQKKLKQFFSEVEQVVFAHALPTQDDYQEAKQTVKHIIEEKP